MGRVYALAVVRQWFSLARGFAAPNDLALDANTLARRAMMGAAIHPQVQQVPALGNGRHGAAEDGADGAVGFRGAEIWILEHQPAQFLVAFWGPEFTRHRQAESLWRWSRNAGISRSALSSVFGRVIRPTVGLKSRCSCPPR